MNKCFPSSILHNNEECQRWTCTLLNGDNPIFVGYRKEESVMAQKNVQPLKKRTEGKRNMGGKDISCQQKGSLGNIYLFYGDMFY